MAVINRLPSIITETSAQKPGEGSRWSRAITAARPAQPARLAAPIRATLDPSFSVSADSLGMRKSGARKS